MQRTVVCCAPCVVKSLRRVGAKVLKGRIKVRGNSDGLRPSIEIFYCMENLEDTP